MSRVRIESSDKGSRKSRRPLPDLDGALIELLDLVAEELAKEYIRLMNTSKDQATEGKRFDPSRRKGYMP
jgi:hypothetical protein